MRLNLESLIYGLPEDILKAKWAGDFDFALKLIDARLKDADITDMLRDRLTVERARLGALLRRYPYTRRAAISEMISRVPDFTEAEFDELEADGCMDFIYAYGEKRYIASFPGTLMRMKPALRARGGGADGDSDRLARAISEMKKKGCLAYAFRVRSELKLRDQAFLPGETYTVHMPVPALCAQQPLKDIIITPEAGGYVSDALACQRTVFYSRALAENAPFTVEYSFVNRVYYVDTRNTQPRAIYAGERAPVDDDLSEQAPHIMFTPYLRLLAQSIAGDCAGDLEAARRVYDYITQNVRYSFMRPYMHIDSHAEYAAINRKGDCGIQAILFIALLRILGIPARWQSGLTVNERETGSHDWAQFYTAEFGWLFADPSFGGSAWRAGDKDKWDFYFGNLDPYRMIANRRYQTNFDPPKAHERWDPYDNQDGEIECRARGFDSNEYDAENSVLECEKRETF